MTDREKLIELLRKGYNETPFYEDIWEGLADYLLANNVIVPPCKVGDTVYTTLCYGIGDWRIAKSVIVEIRKRLGFNLEVIERRTDDKGRCAYFPVVLEHFGVTKFLTKEEAEKALENLKNTK